MFDLAARYAFLAANTYDYETGLLDTSAGRSFVNRIVSARALGVVRNGEPQYADSNIGDPGLSSALAEMKADWDVVKTRLGFNNPDAYGTVASLRTENFRIPTFGSSIRWPSPPRRMFISFLSGVDSMHSPPLGDAGDIRSWTVDDVAIPLPLNIGASQFSGGGFYQSANSLSEPLFAVRAHQSFRPVPSASFFSTSLYGTGGTLQRSQYTNNRLIGRSAWNSQWKPIGLSG